MALTLTVTSYHRLSPDQEPVRSLDQGSLTIGRGAENDWTMPDPERVISKLHCRVDRTADGYVLTDCSTNGVFVNGAAAPVGKGMTATLADGDTLRMGDYEIAVSLSGAPAGAAAPSASPTPQPASSPRPLPDAGAAGDDDWRALLDPSASPPPARPMEPEQVRPEQQAITPPAASGGIPDNWFDDDAAQAPAPEPPPPPAAGPLPEDAGLAHPPAEPATQPVPEVREPAAPPAAPPQSAAEPVKPATPADVAALHAFLRGAGLDPSLVPEERAAEVMERAGRVFRETVQGVMDVLSARSAIKNEFRLERTIIQAQKNNPLKFSPVADEAMKTMLLGAGQGFLSSEDAFQEAFDDLRAHQVAVLAGMQVALAGVLKRFDPARLEQRIGQDTGVASLLGGKKARYWDAFTQLYGDIAEEMEEDFHSVFGREFARAYEEQIRKQGQQRG